MFKLNLTPDQRAKLQYFLTGCLVLVLLLIAASIDSLVELFL